MDFGNFGGFGGGMPNMGAIMKLRQAWTTFCTNHPKMPGFIAGVKEKGFCEGQEIAIAVRYPDGTEYKTGIKVQQSDLELLETLRHLNG